MIFYNTSSLHRHRSDSPRGQGENQLKIDDWNKPIKKLFDFRIVKRQLPIWYSMSLNHKHKILPNCQFLSKYK